MAEKDTFPKGFMIKASKQNSKKYRLICGIFYFRVLRKSNFYDTIQYIQQIFRSYLKYVQSAIFKT